MQAETLWAMRKPGPFPAAAFQEAWRNVLLYSEHTWGAHNSISQPDLPFVRDQWKVKQAFALDADKQSRTVAGRGAPKQHRRHRLSPAEVDVFNTSSWPRTDLVTLPAEQSAAGDRVVDDKGKPVPSQRLATANWCSWRATCRPSRPNASGWKPAPAAAARLSEGGRRHAGPPGFHRAALTSARAASSASSAGRLNRELVDAKAATALNDYFYLPGSDLKGLQRNGTPRITREGEGPAGGLAAHRIRRARLQAPRPRSARGGRPRLASRSSTPWTSCPCAPRKASTSASASTCRTAWCAWTWAGRRCGPELDQIPASCKNWFSVQRWVDISNDRFGVTWSPVDAPLVRGRRHHGQPDRLADRPRVWIQHLEPSQTHLLVGDEQSLAHQLPRRAGRPHRVPLLPSARTRASRRTRRPGSASAAPSR